MSIFLHFIQCQLRWCSLSGFTEAAGSLAASSLREREIEKGIKREAVALQAVPSYKLLPLGYQMVSRLAEEQSTFQAVLRKVLARLAIEHPHHMLLHILSLTHLSGSGRDSVAASLLDVRAPLQTNACR